MKTGILLHCIQNFASTLQRTKSVYITKTYRSKQHRNMIGVWCEEHLKHVIALGYRRWLSIYSCHNALNSQVLSTRWWTFGLLGRKFNRLNNYGLLKEDHNRPSARSDSFANNRSHICQHLSTFPPQGHTKTPNRTHKPSFAPVLNHVSPVTNHIISWLNRWLYLMQSWPI